MQWKGAWHWIGSVTSERGDPQILIYTKKHIHPMTAQFLAINFHESQHHDAVVVIFYSTVNNAKYVIWHYTQHNTVFLIYTFTYIYIYIYLLYPLNDQVGNLNFSMWFMKNLLFEHKMVRLWNKLTISWNRKFKWG